MEKIIKFDRQFRQSKCTYNFFGGIHEDIRSKKYSRIVLDLTEYTYINPVYGVLIGSMPYVGNIFDCEIVIRINPNNSNCKEFLNKLGILEHYNGVKNKKKSVDLKNIMFNKYETIEGAFPTVGKILETAPVEFSKIAKETMDSKLAELFLNAFTHSNSKIGVCCSGYVNTSNIFYFSIYDAGVGIHKNVKEYLKKDINAVDSMKWAFEPAHSTLKVDYPRGAGLHLFDSFAKANNGSFDMVSGKAYRKLHSNCNVRYHSLENELQGTIISISIKPDRICRYILNKEKENIPC